MAHPRCGYTRRIEIDRYELALAVGGAVALAAAWLPMALRRRPLSLPILLVAVGAGLFVLPTGLPDPDPTLALDVTERLTEIGVIVALMGAGLKLDRPFTWARWRTTARLLLVAMPLSIAGVALLGGWVLGLGPAAALLLGCVLAPTDPVLAADVQVGEPSVESDVEDDTAPDTGVPGVEGVAAGSDGAAGTDGDAAGGAEDQDHGEEEDEVRFALTSEAGLNDALAFPFVYLAIRWASDGTDPGEWLLPWFGIDVVFRLAVGLVVGYLIGRLLAFVLFRGIGRSGALADAAQGFVAIAATLLAYGVTEMVQGYGFLAVFVAAVTLRASERRHAYHQVLHEFSEQAEQLLVVGLLVLFGGALVGGLFGQLSWGVVAVALAAIFLVRPLSAWLSLQRLPIDRTERHAIAFFGVRGVGSFYYLAYAVSEVSFDDVQVLWSTVSLTVLLSIIVHGVTATPAMATLDRRRGRRIRWWRRPRLAAGAGRTPLRDEGPPT